MPFLSRRSFLGTALATASLRLPSSAAAGPTPVAPCSPPPTWIDVADFPIEGRAFAARKAPYDRLPLGAEAVVRSEVWDLSRHSAGMVVRFATASPEIHVRYRLTSARIDLAHMPATGVSGVDLYGLDGARWRWMQVSRPAGQVVEMQLVQGLPTRAEPRSFQLYLPLYNGVDKLELGVGEGFDLLPLPRRSTAGRSIVCYGTSILHGASASRPGMAWPAIVGRTLDREVFNFGFAGNGRMEREVVQFLVELDPEVFVVDCLPNMSTEQVAERTEPLVRQLRLARKDTPILLVEDRTFANAWCDETRAREHQRRRAALRAAVAAMVRDGVKGLHLLDGADLLGTDGEGTTDGSHPNDLGMMRQADKVLAALQPLLPA